MKTMQMVPPDDQIFNQSKLCHLLAKFSTNASGAIWWSNLQLMQVVPSGGQNCNLYKWRHLVAKFATYTSGAIWCPKNATNASGAMLLLNLIPSHAPFVGNCDFRKATILVMLMRFTGIKPTTMPILPR